METKARQTLNAAGVHTIFYVAYLNYARQLDKLSRQHGISGESFEGTGTAFRCGKPCLYPVRLRLPRSCSTSGLAVASTQPSSPESAPRSSIPPPRRRRPRPYAAGR